VERFLNQDPVSPEHQRVLEIVAGLQELDLLLSSLRFTPYDDRISFCDLNQQSRGLALQQSLNEKLALYSYTPSVGIPFKLAGERHRLDVGLNALAATSLSETAIIKIIVELADNGKLRMLKKCLNCGNWFKQFKSDHQRCAICCQTDYRKTDAGKQNNRKHAAANYQKRRDARLEEVRQVLKKWPAKSHQKTKADWKDWVLQRVNKDFKIYRRFLTRAADQNEIKPPA
jgi:hypothetical protein